MTSGVVKIDPFDLILRILGVISIFRLVNIVLRGDRKIAKLCQFLDSEKF